jgi:hypothetical protein
MYAAMKHMSGACKATAAKSRSTWPNHPDEREFSATRAGSQFERKDWLVSTCQRKVF